MRETSSVPEFLTTVPSLTLPVSPCGCGVDLTGDVVATLGVDPAARDRNLKRLRRIEGQVRGLQKMIEEDRYCADVLMQVSSVHEALRAVGRELMRGHVRYAAAIALQSGSGDEFPDEIIDMVYRAAR